MTTLSAILVIATLLCSLVAGLLLAFAAVVMPGIRSFNDLLFLQTFQRMDRVIQNQQPVFMAVWLGSTIALIAATTMGISQLDGIDRRLLTFAGGAYLLGVQLPTAAIHLPANNRLQELDLDAITPAQLRNARINFEPRWVRWNTSRTTFAITTTLTLLIVLIRL